MLVRYKTHCKVTSVTNHMFVFNVRAAYQLWIITGSPNLSQVLVLKIKSNLESCTCKCRSKSARRLFLLRGVTLDFRDLASHEHQHRASLSKKEWLFSRLDAFTVLIVS